MSETTLAGDDGDQNPSLNITLRKKVNTAENLDESLLNDTPATTRSVNMIIQREIQGLMKHLNETLANHVNKELKLIKEELVQVKESMTFIDNKYEEIKSGIDVKFSQVQTLQKENDQLRVAVRDLTTKVNLMEQQSRSSNVEIQCLPEFKSENLVSTVLNIGRVISCDLNENNIHNVTRIAKQNPTSTRPKSIIVRFCSPRVRDSFLAAAIKFNKSKTMNEKLNSSLIGIAGNKEDIYIVEHLSPINRDLHAKARKKSKELNYKYVWVRSGKIFMRKTDGSEYKYIKDIETLNKLE